VQRAKKAQLILGRSDDLSYDMVPALMRGLAVWNVDRGGGRPSLAQGGGVCRFSAGCASCAKCSHRSNPFSRPPVKPIKGGAVQELAPGILWKPASGVSNVGAILTNDGFVLIDTPPFPDDARTWRILLSQLSDKPILAVVSTDCHRDRMLGNSWFDSAVIVAHGRNHHSGEKFPHYIRRLVR